MAAVKYLLTILTNGRQTCFERSVYAFMQHVRPLPSAIYVFDDGAQTGKRFVYETLVGALDRFAPDVQTSLRSESCHDSSSEPLGMCAAYKHCTDYAAASDYDWTFHLEDDFVILRPLDLRDMAAVLDAEKACKQMALVRCPWGREIEHGGYIPQFPGLYERRRTTIDEGREISYPHGAHAQTFEWIATQRNWATNPALMRTSLLREFPCDGQPGCETEIGPRIIEKYPDSVFGLWGWGEPWSAHIALERTPGAFGY